MVRDMEANELIGVMRRRDLDQDGWDRRTIERALATGGLSRLRQGWYATPNADERVVRAVRAGGVLACASAIAWRGGWDTTRGVIHVRMGHNHTGALPPGLVRCHPVGSRDEDTPILAVDEFPTALRCAWRCLEQEDFVAACDSLVNRGLAQLDDIAAALGPVAHRDDVLSLCDWADSGTESLVRLRLRRLGIRVRAQVPIPTVGRVDLLVGDRLVIEVDSVAHHTSLDDYHRDRHRDLRLKALGYTVLRLTYQQVVLEWPEVEQTILSMVRRRVHLRQK